MLHLLFVLVHPLVNRRGAREGRDERKESCWRVVRNGVDAGLWDDLARFCIGKQGKPEMPQRRLAGTEHEAPPIWRVSYWAVTVIVPLRSSIKRLTHLPGSARSSSSSYWACSSSRAPWFRYSEPRW